MLYRERPNQLLVSQTKELQQLKPNITDVTMPVTGAPDVTVGNVTTILPGNLTTAALVLATLISSKNVTTMTTTVTPPPSIMTTTAATILFAIPRLNDTPPNCHYVEVSCPPSTTTVQMEFVTPRHDGKSTTATAATTVDLHTTNR